ncbi:TetR/AcrR family transcriptional regulator C-terminal domain-containing protein [Conexibacter woesei]|uniref:Transcriptional regulator, TetR family n=1 Tax=Conexibacter woesei (strain DSM 14684 / CCUG 47730 / CIP 108061 / JCM 11494 / NBRC 100937 / ID131577) TaxID=469383 RepID=D3F0Q3_CONWI|nr:TetR/AcrR family transcriptional regulator C-terminal domain-containing protein [Conexibacter woesei]ADB53987.1 transcriptional regulator, TetR family [Conexibacter woesei DSM 14684]
MTITGRQRGRTGHRRQDATSVWLRTPRATREGPALSPARIVEEAVALLDEAGVEGLTMRRLADRLGAGVTTLYWHVETKDDMVDLALDAIFGETPVPSEAPDARTWRDGVVGVLNDWRATMLRHPWSAALLQRPTLGPNLLARMEYLQAALVSAGFSDQRLTAATWTLYNYVMGATVAKASHELSADDRQTAQQRLHDQRDRYPTLSASDYMLQDDWDGTFTTGLTYLLDGIAADSAPVKGADGCEIASK